MRINYSSRLEHSNDVLIVGIAFFYQKLTDPKVCMFQATLMVLKEHAIDLKIGLLTSYYSDFYNSTSIWTKLAILNAIVMITSVK